MLDEDTLTEPPPVLPGGAGGPGSQELPGRAVPSVLHDLEVVLGAAAGDPALLGPVRIPQPVPLEVWAAGPRS